MKPGLLASYDCGTTQSSGSCSRICSPSIIPSAVKVNTSLLMIVLADITCPKELPLVEKASTDNKPDPAVAVVVLTCIVSTSIERPNG